MATRVPVTSYGPNNQRNGVLVVWSALANGDDGTPWEHADYGDRTVHFTGTFGAGGSVTFQGSNDGTNWFALTDPQGNAITKTAAGIEVVSENPRFVRPIVTAGDGTTALVATMWGRRNR